MKSHVLNLLIFASCISVFFAVLYQDTKRDRVRHFLKWFTILVGSAFVLGWIMYEFPRNPYF
ncbi:MAG: hypothetical protein CO090_07815 [Acidobacteria bacterium CG_4_9_14_3_um_filter_49_7]|nr:MAG: hypothetical protein CO090_07815 [Acidobacteria bacterium CG_4_9_14_3_um_filter_49_7]